MNRSRPWILALLLFVLVTVWYWPTVGFDFVGVDDPNWVTNNPHVLRGLDADSVRWAFTSAHASNWLPLTWISLMADASGGETPDPAPFHRTNVLLHALGAALLFLSLWRLTGEVWPSLLVASLFALHPLRVESVAWVTERKDVLSGVFWFACMLAYAEWVRTRRRVWYAGVALLLAAGLMAKAILVTLPAVFLLLDVWPLRRAEGWARRFVEKIPFFALAAAMAVATFLAQRGGGAVSDLDQIGLADRVITAFVAYARYVLLTVWPHDLSYLYLHPVLRDGDSWGGLVVFGCMALLVVLSGAALVACRRGFAVALIGWLWFLGTLVPVIGIVQVGSQWMADRYTYIPQIGLWLVVAWASRSAARRWKPVPLVALSIVVVAGLATLTQRQLGVWKDSESLYEHAIRLDERHYYALNGLGVSRAQAGDTAGAVRLFQQSIRVRPLAAAHVNLGNVHTMRREYDRAAEQYRGALALEPDSPSAHLNLGNVYLATQEPGLAREHYAAVLRSEPFRWRAWAGSGRAAMQQGIWDEAVRALTRALELRPHDRRIRQELDEARARVGSRP